MKRLMMAIVFFACVLVPCLADDADLQSRVKSIEETVDQMKRDSAGANAQSLSQPLDWGKGWSVSLNLGNLNDANVVGSSITSPLLFNYFRIGLENTIWVREYYPEPISNPETQYLTGADQEGLRIDFVTPLFMNLCRLYSGVGIDGEVCVINIIQNGQTPSTPSAVIIGLTEDVHFGTEFFLSKHMSVNMEYMINLSFTGISNFWNYEGDESLSNRVNDMLGTGGSANIFKIGVRFYF